MSLWQTKSWQEMLKKSGQIEEYFRIPLNPPSSKDAEILIEKRKVSLGEYGLFVIGVDNDILQNTSTETIQNLCKKENCLFVQIETLDYFSLRPSDTSLNEENFKNLYYKKFIPPFTIVIDLKQTEEEILAGMKPKGRYNINLARKKGVTCNIVPKTKENIRVFFELLKETTSRDGFTGNSLTYYENFLKEIKDSELILAQYEGKYIAGGIFVFQKDDIALYYYGASSSEARNLMAPYLVQWTAIEEAKRQGCTLYDFLGVAGVDEKDSPLAGVTDFKLKFSSDRRLVSESYLWINKKWKYTLIQFIKNQVAYGKK